jgi:hypothetical protein
VGLRHVAVATTLALVGAMLAASPAQARPEVDAVDPVDPAVQVIQARDGNHFPVTISTTVPPGGTSMITTPTLSKDTKSLTVTVKPKNLTSPQDEDYQNFINGVGSLSKGQKLLVCVMMYQVLSEVGDYENGQFQMTADYLTLGGAILLACLQFAGLIQAKQGVRASAASDKCGQIQPSLPATVTKTGEGYSVSASGTAAKAKKPKLKMKCTVTGNTVRYTIRPRKKGQTLRKAAGKKIMVGLKSPNDAQTSVPVQVTFSTP